MDEMLTAGHRFLLAHARLLERRLFDTCFLGAPATGVMDALRGYQNDDGGFGHALEPDTRVAASLPIYIETAFGAMVSAGAVDRPMVVRAADFLDRTAAEAGSGGAVPLAFPVIESAPRAAHWSDWTYRPGLNPTAGLVGRLHQFGVDHPWTARGTAYCWAALEAVGLPAEAHELSEVLIFLAQTPERGRAAEYIDALAGHLATVNMLHLDPDAPGYGLTPLQLAPEPGSPWRALFTDAQIDAHLDHLQGAQQADGGWPITWEPPDGAAALEWRGVVTLEALRTLASYGRLATV
jgi:hypothetical protein